MNNRKWLDYLLESQDDAYKQKLYKVPMRFKVRKEIGGNKSETEDDLRAVPYITALSLPRDRKSDGENWYMTYDLKFALPSDVGDAVNFVTAVIPVTPRVLVNVAAALAANVVNAPVPRDAAPTFVPSIAPASMSTSSK